MSSRSTSAHRRIDTRAAAEWFAHATGIIQDLRRRYAIPYDAEGLDTVRFVDPAELAQQAQNWTLLQARSHQLGLTAGRWLYDLEHHERLAPPTFLPATTVRATFREETGWTYCQQLRLDTDTGNDTTRDWLEQHGAQCEPLYDRDEPGDILAWNIQLPDTLTCRIRTGTGQRILAYLADGSSQRLRAGSLTLAPQGCDIVMARPRKKRRDALDWAAADRVLGRYFLWVNNP